MQNNSNSNIDQLILALTKSMQTILLTLQERMPEKEFTLRSNEANAYWAFHWNSTKLFKTEHPVKEWFSVTLYPQQTGFSLDGTHEIKDVFEQLGETHFKYEEPSILEIYQKLDKAEKQIQKAVIQAVDQKFDPSY